MRRIGGLLRFFFVSPEMFIVLFGLFVDFHFSKEMTQLIASFSLSDDPLKYVLGIPPALCVWSFLFGRQVLFPQKDKANLLQKWPDFWRLKGRFHIALTWNVLFAIASLLLWFGDWKHPSPHAIIMLSTSIAGSAACWLSIYNAQTMVEELLARYQE